MQLASLVYQYLKAFKAQYVAQLLPSHLRAIGAIRRCRTPDSGRMLLHCSECTEQLWRPQSCGHRSCPQCQTHEASQWLDRQQAKFLPVEYFMVTFTLPCELRALARVFRARLLAAIKAAGLALPAQLPEQWVVDCKHVGKGKPALKYLSRYLYRARHLSCKKDICLYKERACPTTG